MKIAYKRMLSLLLLFTLLLGAVPASAAERSSDYLNAYSVTTVARSGGRIIVNVEVSALGYMDEIGATSIHVHESTNNGLTWTPVADYYCEDDSNFISSGFFFNEDLVTYQGVAGRKYRAIAYVYAGDETGFDEKRSVSNTVLAYN